MHYSWHRWLFLVSISMFISKGASRKQLLSNFFAINNEQSSQHPCVLVFVSKMERIILCMKVKQCAKSIFISYKIQCIYYARCYPLFRVILLWVFERRSYSVAQSSAGFMAPCSKVGNIREVYKQMSLKAVGRKEACAVPCVIAQSDGALLSPISLKGWVCGTADLTGSKTRTRERRQPLDESVCSQANPSGGDRENKPLGLSFLLSSPVCPQVLGQAFKHQ